MRKEYVGDSCTALCFVSCCYFQEGTMGVNFFGGLVLARKCGSAVGAPAESRGAQPFQDGIASS
jgi:hypothetical protein